MKNIRIRIPLVILIIGSLGCGLFSSSGSDAEIVLPATEVGTPEGPNVTKDIGPAGGTLASPDGRLTLTVPPNALTETVPFSIQPITNKAGGGLGLAYRLEPDGKTFTTPLEISVRYDEDDLEGTVPKALSIAYQDEKGAWHAQTSAKLDQAAKTITVSTTHFTDFAFITRLKLSPSKAILHVGESQVISLVLCEKPNLIERFLNREPPCTSHRDFNSEMWRIQGAGTFDFSGGPGNTVYEAPGEKPTPNKAWVIYSYELEEWDETRSAMVTVKGELGTEITILDRSYRATGQDGPVTYSGVICSLDGPFEVTGKHPIFSFPFKFVPSSPTAGTMSYSVSASVIKASGGGTYTIEGAGTDSPRIVIISQSTASIPVITTSGGGTATIKLVPLETDECQ